MREDLKLFVSRKIAKTIRQLHNTPRTETSKGATGALGWLVPSVVHSTNRSAEPNLGAGRMPTSPEDSDRAALVLLQASRTAGRYPTITALPSLQSGGKFQCSLGNPLRDLGAPRIKSLCKLCGSNHSTQLPAEPSPAWLKPPNLLTFQ